MQRLAIAALLSLTATACSASKLDWSEVGSRALWQHPDRVVESLDIEPGDRVVDLGAGDGYFVPFLSQAVGPTGTVYAVDVDANAVLDLTERVEASGLGNVEVVLGDVDDPQVPDASIDVVLLVNSYHHIEARRAYFAHLRSDLAPSGRVAVIEPDEELGGWLGLFLSEGHTSSRARVRQEMGDAGYAPAESHRFLPVQVFEVFGATYSPAAFAEE